MTWLNPIGAAAQGSNLDTQVAWLRVADGGGMSPELSGFVQAQFRRHKATIANGIIGYSSIDYTLPDGTRMHVQSNSGIHHVTVFPVRLTGGTRLPHGFAVVTEQGKAIYGENNAGWDVRTRDVPQAGDPILSDNYVIVTREDAAPLLIPLVRQRRALWGNRRHAAFDFGADDLPVAAALFITSADDVVSTDPPTDVHSLVDNEVRDGEGVVRFTMPDTDAILLDPEEIHYEPGITDTRGTRIILQSWRRGLLSESAQIEQFRLCNEVVKRTAVDTYEQVARNVVDLIVGPSGNAAETTESESGATLDDEEPDADDLVHVYRTLTSGTNFGDNRIINWEVAFPEVVGTVASTVVQATFERLVQGLGGVTPVGGLIAMPAEEGLSYVGWNAQLNYPDTTFWRAGTYRKNAGYGSPPLTTAYWQTEYCEIYRVDAQHDRECEPRVWLDIPWVPSSQFLVFEGIGQGHLLGGYAKDTRRETCNSGGLEIADNITYVFTTLPSSGTSGPFETQRAYANGSPANARQNELATPHLPFAPTVDIISNEENIPLVADLEYSYTSRHIIDFDARSQFYAAIKVTVVCSGAAWSETVSLGYRGYLQQDVQPTYSVQIEFEWCWEGETHTTQLASDACTRAGFEFAQLEHINMFAWPATVDPTVYWMPPTIAPPAEAAQQLAAVMGHQGTNPHYAGADVLADGESSKSDRGIEFSTDDGKVLRAAAKWVPGMLYARTFTLADLDGALWLLDATKCSAAENDDPLGDGWFYMPDLGALIAEQEFHIELRDGELLADPLTWTGDISDEATASEISIHRV